MTNTTIKVEGLSKRYRIGVRQKAPDTLAGHVLSLVKQPISNLRRLRRRSA